MNRRDFITAICVGSAAGLAGCGGQDGVPAGDSGEAGSPEPTPAGTPAGSTPEGGSGSNGDSGSTDDPGSTDDAGSAEGPALSDIETQPANSWRFRYDATSSGETDVGIVEGRWYEGDYTTSMTMDGQNVVSSFVDGTYYYQQSGECFEMDSDQQQGGVDTQQWADTDETTSELDDWQNMTPTRTATIDGEQMHVFELTPGEHNVESTVTYYVSAETGYLRRVETQGVTVDYWDWGNADPIEPPC